MLQKKYRLQSKKDFQRIFRAIRPSATENLIFRAAKNQLGAVRFGFIISNKIDKRATRRNALKRQLRKIAGDLISELKGGYDIVILVKRNFKHPYSQEEIRGQFLEGMKKTGILK